MSSFIKEAEKNVIRTARSFEDLLKVLDAMNNFGNRACHEFVGQKEFFDGLHQMRLAILKEYSHALSQCFIFVGVGGEDAAKYSREKFKEYFGEERMAIMHFLEDFGQRPSSWLRDDEKEFQKQAKDKIDQFD